MTISELLIVFRKHVALVLIGSLVAGCVTTGQAGNSSLSPDEQTLRAQEEEFNRTVVGGVVAGAVAGALLGALLGDDNRSAVIGAGLGAAAGGLAGSYVANKKQQYATEQARLDSVKKDVKADNQRVEQVIATTNRVIAKNKGELELMKRQVASGTKQQSEMVSLIKKVRDNRDALSATIAKLNERKTEYYQASSTTGTSNAGTLAEIRKLEEQISSLENDLKRFDEILKVNRLS